MTVSWRRSASSRGFPPSWAIQIIARRAHSPSSPRARHVPHTPRVAGNGQGDRSERAGWQIAITGTRWAGYRPTHFLLRCAPWGAVQVRSAVQGRTPLSFKSRHALKLLCGGSVKGALCRPRYRLINEVAHLVAVVSTFDQPTSVKCVLDHQYGQEFLLRIDPEIGAVGTRP
jgi:hypothetical protein